ncbi:hypothetical protein ACCO45_008294 [Purpureocillium lilacinum]|uniref:Uncharacterized protein n=1 Tax=Purpureocillium lilacinum TaxID=33203 RepID=A0ACC4DQJ9_PURLI
MLQLLSVSLAARGRTPAERVAPTARRYRPPEPLLAHLDRHRRLHTAESPLYAHVDSRCKSPLKTGLSAASRTAPTYEACPVRASRRADPHPSGLPRRDWKSGHLARPGGHAVPRQARENWYTRHFFPAPLPLSCANYSSSSGLLHTEIWTAHLRPSRARGGTRSNGPPSYRRTGRVRQYHSCAASVPPAISGVPVHFRAWMGDRCGAVAECGARGSLASLALVVSDSVSASVVVRARAVGHRPVVCSPTDVAIVGSVPWIAACQFPAWLALIHRSSLCMKQAHRNINITSRRVYNIHFSTAHVCTHT